MTFILHQKHAFAVVLHDQNAAICQLSNGASGRGSNDPNVNQELTLMEIVQRSLFCRECVSH
jgi:hypothetical protein